MVTYRIVKDQKRNTYLYQIVDGSVGELEPNAEDRKREPGIYDANFKLIKREIPPWKTASTSAGPVKRPAGQTKRG
jgi:hypothetical protein